MLNKCTLTLAVAYTPIKLNSQYVIIKLVPLTTQPHGWMDTNHYSQFTHVY